ncbi:MAG TPA: type II secretion system protein [Candidatus Dormibacteraeota bacterium]|nr:type II secretion system protein [Candidatus Dormibacteraeota bacterium]
MKALRRLLHEQSGFTAVEMIVTMALVTVVTGGMVSTFAIFDRVQTAWRDRNQARAVSVVAEEAIVRDARVYRVVSASGATLVLQAPSDGDGPTFTVSYSVNQAGQELIRTVQPGNSQTVVAHGVANMTASCNTGQKGVVHVLLSIAAVGAGPNDAKTVDDVPGFDVASRNQTGSVCA